MESYEDFLERKLKDIQFEDAFDLEELQELQDVMSNSLQIASVMTTKDGTFITEPSNFCSLCQDYIRKTEVKLKECRHLNEVIGGKYEGYTVSKCLYTGLVYAGVSLVVGERHVANWMFGQVRQEQEQYDRAEIETKAEQLGIPKGEYLEAFLQAPAVSKKRFENIAKLFYKVSQQISEQAYQRCLRKIDKEYRELLNEEMEHQKERAEYANSIDELTGLNNRNYFEKQIERLDFLGVTPVAVIVGDVNYLKITNDIFGHRHGDNLLSTIAEIMRQESFDDYIICRCGGDEYNVIMPNAKRADAEWFCNRVRIELSKCFDLCVMPSIAFGVGKKSHKHESIKAAIEQADARMYRQKTSMKEAEKMQNNMQRVLLGRGFLTNEYEQVSISMARRFGTYLELPETDIKKLTRIVRIQDYGMLPLSREVFARRFEMKKLSIEARREIMKHPILSSKIAQLDLGYATVADLVAQHEEHWDSNGYPNQIGGEDIPLLARLSKIIGDYNLFMANPPLGIEKSQEEALQMLQEQAGTVYDPNYIEKFVAFIGQDHVE